MAGIQDKVVVITGASSGIGEATAQPADVDVGEIIVRPTAQS